ncbi:MAG TPA: hypothetical protein VEA59_01670 [Patescibacteria group bacterium]|nr:hypothetical protein [Patescibacteria group bacterium]
MAKNKVTFVGFSTSATFDMLQLSDAMFKLEWKAELIVANGGDFSVSPQEMARAVTESDLVVVAFSSSPKTYEVSAARLAQEYAIRYAFLFEAGAELREFMPGGHFNGLGPGTMINFGIAPDDFAQYTKIFLPVNSVLYPPSQPTGMAKELDAMAREAY